MERNPLSEKATLKGHDKDPSSISFAQSAIRFIKSDSIE